MPAPAYFSCTGKTQGLITRNAFTADSVDNIYVEGHEDECMIQAYSHSMTMPADPQSGQPTGQRRHQPFVIMKDFDKASPLLSEAFATGELLEKCKLKFYRTSAEGRQEHYYSIILTDAAILNITSGMPSARSGADSGAGETVSFSYRKIEWVNMVSDTYGSADWRRPA